MSDSVNLVYKAMEEQLAGQPASSRRRFMKGVGATLGGLGVLGALPAGAAARHRRRNSTEAILTVATSAEVLATIVNTIGFERNLAGDPVTQRNIRAAAREELLHYQKLVQFGGKPLSKRIWVPDKVFSNRTNFLNTLEVGDDIFVRAYNVATEAFADRGKGDEALTTAQFMGVEAVHRALARQSLGKLGNDRVFQPEGDREEARDAPDFGSPGIENVEEAVAQLQMNGFGFGKPGASPGTFYDFDEVSRRTPNDPDLNTFQTDLD